MQSKMVFKICEGISCSLFYVKEFDVIVHTKVFSLYNSIKFFTIQYPTSLANLVVEVGTRHSHQILLVNSTSPPWPDQSCLILQIFDFELSDADMQTINGLDQNIRIMVCYTEENG